MKFKVGDRVICNIHDPEHWTNELLSYVSGNRGIITKIRHSFLDIDRCYQVVFRGQSPIPHLCRSMGRVWNCAEADLKLESGK